MTADPIDPHDGPSPAPGTTPYEVIHLGGQSAVVVPMTDFLRLRALERAASADTLEAAEDAAAMHDWRDREAAGSTSYVSAEEVHRQLGLAQ